MSEKASEKMSIVVSCIDHRFWPETLSLCQKKFGHFDSIQLAGASKNIASASNPANKKTLLENIKIAIKLHLAETLILTNHLDCGAYGGSKNFTSFKEEFDFHKKELDRAKKIAEKIFPRLKVKTFFVVKNKKGKVEIK